MKNIGLQIPNSLALHSKRSEYISHFRHWSKDSTRNARKYKYYRHLIHNIMDNGLHKNRKQM